MKLSKDWKIIIAVWVAVGGALLALLITSEIQLKRNGSANSHKSRSASVQRNLGEWHINQIETYFKESPMKPPRWGVAVEDVNGANISIVLLTMDSNTKEERELSLRYMCPPADALLWHGLNQHNTIYLNVRYPLDMTTSLAWWKCDGPKAKAKVAVSPTTK